MARPSGRGGEWGRELDTFARAFAGAFLFGIPLLYTMEMWWIGTYLPPVQVVLFLAVALAVGIGLAHVSGFRDERHAHWSDLEQAVEALAVGIVGSLVVLLALDRIAPGDPAAKVLGIVGLQAVPLSLGAGLARAVLVGKGGRTGDEAPSTPGRALAADVGATAIGAVFVSFNVAPTEEVTLLATALDAPHLVAVVALSLVAGYVIVFESGFGRHEARRAQPGPFQQPVTETALSYVVALGVAAVTLALFGQLASGSASDAVARTVVLGFPAMVGGAAGRLAV